MFCSQCGNQIPDDAVFCPECGAKTDVEMMEGPVTAPEQPYAPEENANVVPEQNNNVEPEQTYVPEMNQNAAPEQNYASNMNQNTVSKPQKADKKPVPKVLFVLLGVVAAVAVIFVAAVVLLLNHKSYDTISDQANYVSTLNAVAVNLKGEVITLSGDASQVDSNADKSVSAYITYDDERTLYVVKDMKEVKIADDVASFKICYSGDVIAYVQADAGEYTGDLFLYSVKKNESDKIAKDVSNNSYTLSPKGERVAYLGDYEDSDDYKLYVSGKNGKATEIEKDGGVVLAVNDKGNIVYYLKNSKLYLHKGNKDEKIDSDVSNDRFFFNKDLTEVLFNKKGKAYLYELGAKESIKLKSDAIYNVFMPNDAASYSSLYGVAQIIGKSSFKNTLVDIGYNTCWINKKGNAVVELEYYQYTDAPALVDTRYRKAIVRDNYNLYAIDNLTSNMQPKRYDLDENIETFIASKDLKNVYFVNDDDELFYIKGKKTEKISNDITDNQVVYSEALDAVVFVEDGELYYAKKTQKSKKLITDAEVSFLETDGRLVTFEADDDGDSVIYVLDEKGEPVELGEY